MFGLGTGEIILVLILVLLIYGPNRLPELARKAGRVFGDVKRTSDEFVQEFSSEVEKVKRTIDVDVMKTNDDDKK